MGAYFGGPSWGGLESQRVQLPNKEGPKHCSNHGFRGLVLSKLAAWTLHEKGGLCYWELLSLAFQASRLSHELPLKAARSNYKYDEDSGFLYRHL